MRRLDCTIEPGKKDDDLVARQVRDVVRRAREERIPSVRILVSDPRDVLALARVLREVKRPGGPAIEVIAPDPLLSENEKLRRVLEIAGADRVLGIPPGGRTATDDGPVPPGEALPVESGGQAQDFVRYHTYFLDGVPVREAVVRLNYDCNERCLFCWLFPDQPEIPPEQVRETLRRLAGEGIESICLSGGEPSLSPRLLEYVILSKSLGFREIVLQTNGVLLASRRRVQELEAAGLTMVFLALHSHLPDVGERITRLGGAQKKTVAALRHLLQSRIRVCVNSVLTVFNVPDLPAFARFCAEQAEQAGRGFVVNFSVPAPIGQVDAAFAGYIPRLRDLRAVLPDALDILSQSPVTVLGFFTSSCSPPLCAVGERVDLLRDLREISDEDWARDYANDFLKPEPCRVCRLARYCVGLRRAYAERFGTDEVSPFR